VTRGLDEPEEGGIQIVLACLRAQLARCGLREQSAFAQEEQGVAPVRLVHHVARDEQGRTLRGESMEELPEVTPEDRIEPHGGLV
jgi:hypothetical protein